MKKTIPILVMLAFFFLTSRLDSQTPTVSVQILSTMPIAGINPTTVSHPVNDKIYMFGLQLPPYTGVWTASREIRTYDLKSNTWSVLPVQLPYDYFDFATYASYFNQHFYLGPGFTTGNSNGFGSHNKMIDVDLNNNTSSETSHSFYAGYIWNLSSIEVNGKIYFFGGYYYPAPIKKIFEYDPSTNVLKEVAVFINGRNSVNPVLGNDGWIYCFGSFTNTIERFNPGTYEVQLMKSTTTESHNSADYSWNVSNESAIYFFKGQISSPALYKYDYAKDVIINTGITMQGVYHGRSIYDNSDPYSIYGLKEDLNGSANPCKLVKLKLNLCSSQLIKDTAKYFVSSREFATVSPKIIFESTANLTTRIGGCDSIVNYFSEFIYNPSYCSVTDTLIIDVTLTGITPPENINTIKIYPNPAHSYVIISTGNYTEVSDYTIRITDLQGKKVYETLMDQSEFQVDISSFGSYGTYLVTIIDNTSNLVTTRKLILK